MLSFDAKGHLKPYEAIASTVDELKKVFVEDFESEARLQNFEKYIRYSNELKSLIGANMLKQWINGSFSTKKLNPKDIDLVTFISHEDIQKHGAALNAFKGGNCWDIYGVDAYIIELHSPDDKLYTFTESDSAYWRDLFTTTRRNRQGQKFHKGFLEIFY